MTTKTKATADSDTAAEEQPAKAEQAPLCGKPHCLPVLHDITCTQPAPDPDRPPGAPEHEHRYENGDLVYIWH